MSNIFPFRIHFTKEGKLRFLSHHDLMRTFERALRRTELPLRFTEGFNPHPHISFPTALGIGIESFDEIAEVELTSWIAPKQIEIRINMQMPEGIKIKSVEPFDRKNRSVIEFVEYDAKFLKPMQDFLKGINTRIDNFLKTPEVILERQSDKGTKLIDVRKYALAITLNGDTISLKIKITDSGTAKPEEVLKALGIEVPSPDIRITKARTEIGRR